MPGAAARPGTPARSRRHARSSDPAESGVDAGRRSAAAGRTPAGARGGAGPRAPPHVAAGDCRGAGAGGRRVARLSPAAARAPAGQSPDARADHQRRLPRATPPRAAPSKETSKPSSGWPSSTTRRPSPSWKKRRRATRTRSIRQTAAMLQKNLQVIDQAIAESRAAFRSEPTSAPGARQPVRGAQAQGLAAAGHDRADERDAQGQRRRGRADRRRQPTRADHTPRAPRGGADNEPSRS